MHRRAEAVRTDLIGVSALHASVDRRNRAEANDVRLRVAMRTDEPATAELLLREVESLLCAGPAGGGGYRGRITPSVVTHSAYLARDAIETRIETLVV